MRSTFTVKNQQYELTLEPKERSEEDKFHPYGVMVDGQPGGRVQGTCQVTDEALNTARDKAGASGTSPEDLLARACGRSLASELVIRKLKPDFSFVVDHRWVS